MVGIYMGAVCSEARSERGVRKSGRELVRYVKDWGQGVDLYRMMLVCGRRQVAPICGWAGCAEANA